MEVLGQQSHSCWRRLTVDAFIDIVEHDAAAAYPVLGKGELHRFFDVDFDLTGVPGS